MENPQVIQKAPAEAKEPKRTIYDASSSEIFVKNFLAGFAKAFGGIFVYCLFLAAISYIFISQVYPRIQPFLKQYQSALESLNQIAAPKSQSAPANNPNLQQIIDQNVQKYLEKNPTTTK